MGLAAQRSIRTGKVVTLAGLDESGASIVDPAVKLEDEAMMDVLFREDAIKSQL